MIMMLSHPHPQSELFPKKLPLLPHPPQKKSKKMIQIMELHPLLELGVVHPHPVAVKSLIVFASKRFFCFMVYHMWHGLYVFPLLKNFSICAAAIQWWGNF